MALQRQVIEKLTNSAYIKGPTKQQCKTIKQALINNYDDIEVETWTLKKEIKNKITLSYLHQQLQ